MALRLSSPLSPPISAFSSLSSQCLIHFFSSSHTRRSLLRCHSSKKKETSFGDRILDYIEGGPKLRKWYGAQELLPQDGGLQEEEDESSESEEARDAVLVTDGESEIGQMVILSLILKRARIKALVKDKKAAIDSFGTYVESMVGDVKDKSFLSKSLRGVRAIICAAHDGFISEVGPMKGVQHIVLLSQLAVYRGSSGLQAIINGNLRKLAERDEEVVTTSGIPYTIIRTGSLQSTPAGSQGFSFKEGVAAKGRISKKDAACICVEALGVVPAKGLVFEVVNGEETVSDWQEWFAQLIKEAEEIQR